jgi:hypothetical protein
MPSEKLALYSLQYSSVELFFMTEENYFKETTFSAWNYNKAGSYTGRNMRHIQLHEIGVEGRNLCEEEANIYDASYLTRGYSFSNESC